MFGMGMSEILLILALALIVIGPKKLPDLARSIGKGLAEFRRATDDLQRTIHQEVHKPLRSDDFLKELQAAKSRGEAKRPGAQPTPPAAAETPTGSPAERSDDPPTA